jgi:hypothetical protein
LYDQHPDLLDGFKVLFAMRAEHEEEERKKEESKRRSEMGKGGGRSRPRTSSRGRRR